MATDQQIINIIRSMTNTGLPLGLHTLKAGAMTEDRPRVETIVKDMVAAGELVEIKKNRFQKAGA